MKNDSKEEGVFALPQDVKKRMMDEKLHELSEYHRRNCPPYERLCRGLGEDMPFLPAGVFKEMELKSVSDEEVVKVITSSGTSGQKTSRICLDGETASLQQQALCRITGDFLGSRRRPMLIIDSPDVLRDRRGFSARGAGILGFAMLASSRCYALDRDMKPDLEQIEGFLKEHEKEDLLIFGFTYIVWKHFCMELKRQGKYVDLSRGYLIHGGGWKAMSRQAVSKEVFARELKQVCGIRHISDYYGMAEQTGSIFMECEYGHLHASCYSDVWTLRPEDFSRCGPGEPGILALSALLPKSYPGHRILTEDEGCILGWDNCPCGRKGGYFNVKGRLPGAEIRGCSDTAAAGENRQDTDAPALLAGTPDPDKAPGKSFEPKRMDFLSELSGRICKDPAARNYPEVYGFGFWCRRSNLEFMKKEGRRGKGLVFHIAPGNMPVMFAYSWAVSFLAGNSNLVRLPGKEAPETDLLCRYLEELFEKTEYRDLKESNGFVRYGHWDRQTAAYSEMSDVRILWGGDETIRRIQKIPLKKAVEDIVFPDKYSIGVISPAYLSKLNKDEFFQMVHRFYNDTYSADQNACSSPKFIFWLEDCPEEGQLEAVKQRWWQELAFLAESYGMTARAAVLKYQKLCMAYLEHRGLEPVQRWKNLLYVTECRELPEHLWELNGLCGMFFQKNIRDPEEIFPWLEEKIQTVTVVGTDPGMLERKIRRAGVPGVDRVVEAGQALLFDPVWDRKDLREILSEVDL